MKAKAAGSEISKVTVGNHVSLTMLAPLCQLFEKQYYGDVMLKKTWLYQVRKILKTRYWIFIFKIKRLGILFDYAKLVFIKALKIPTDGKIKLAGYIVNFRDLTQLIQIFREVFVDRQYYCSLPDDPLIIDAGANIGISTLFFKLQYPNAKIIAFEPHPKTFELLKLNVENNYLKGVELRNTALGNTENPISFFVSSDMPDGDIGASTIKQHVGYFHAEKGDILELKVRCEKLSNFITSPIDFLKLDVEGSEANVIEDLNEKLEQVRNIVMEYHYNHTYSENPLSLIILALEKHKHIFRIEGEFDKFKVSKEETYLIRSVRS